MRLVTPIIITRGNVDLKPILDVFLQERGPEVCMPIVWNNSTRAFDLQTLGLYLAASEALSELVYVQDDDCIVKDWLRLVEAWEPGKIVANMPPEFVTAYQTQKNFLIGFGGVFERGLIRQTFERYFKYYGIDPLLLRESNRIFTGLNWQGKKILDVGHVDMEYASGPGRLWTDRAEHRKAHAEAERRILAILADEEKAS